MNHTKKITYTLFGRTAETTAPEFLEKIYMDGLFWLLDRNARFYMRCLRRDQTKMQRYRMILRSSPELEARVTLLAAESPFPVPHGEAGWNWCCGNLPPGEFYPRLVKMVTESRAQGRTSSILREMRRIIETTKEGRDQVMIGRD